ncbi:MAG: hypothetical protein M3Z95_08530 [Actinomycetota bacterium]|nr:hypothetical protein [Actinomycetota bacterium]
MASLLHPMRLHVIHRAAAGGGKRRPEFFSKRVALLSLLRTARACRPPPAITFLNDGEIDPQRLGLMEDAGDVVALSGIGNSPSYRRVLALVDALEADPDDLVFLAEDDYVYVEDALSALLEAAQSVRAADYFTLHDHPNYQRRGGGHRGPSHELAGRSWFSVDNATMSFAARVGRLRADLWIHWLGAQQDFPHDEGIWGAIFARRGFRLAGAMARVDLVPWDRLVLQRAGGRLVRRSEPPVMVCPVPTLATHGEVTDVAAGVDWRAEVGAIEAWAREAGLAAG